MLNWRISYEQTEIEQVSGVQAAIHDWLHSEDLLPLLAEEMEVIIALDRKASECNKEGIIQLRTPLTRYAKGFGEQPWVMDNGSFSNFKENTFSTMAQDGMYDPSCKWIALPDVVGDHEKTLELFQEWDEKLCKHYIPLRPHFKKWAFVVQDGATIQSIPWDEIVAVFLGGTDRMKRSRTAFRIMRHAKKLGKWVHIGRVNTKKWVEYWFWTADSIDGSGLAKYDHMLEDAMKEISRLRKYPEMPTIEDFL